MMKECETLLSTMEKIKQNKEKQRELFQTTVDILASSVAIRDTYTGDHSRRVTLFALLLGEQLHLSAEDLEVIRYATPLHDIGKIGIADGILRKPGPLTPEEFDVMKTHTTEGAKIVEKVPDLRRAVPIIRSHHERWDGHGYPDGLAGEDIPLLARVVAMAEGFDAMAFDSPYRKAMSVEGAFAEFEKEQGRQYDPLMVTAFLQARKDVVEQMQALTIPRGIREDGRR
jgi:putative nucleotidyltransferase with HDIG domain